MILLKIWTREGAKVNNSSDFFSEEDINVSIIMSIYFKRFFLQIVCLDFVYHILLCP